MAVDPTIDLNNTNPAAPANGLNVKWQSTGGNPDHVSAFVPGDGNTGHFLRGDGTFAAPATGGGYPVGANVGPGIFQFNAGSAGSGWGGLSAVMRIAAGAVRAFGTGVKLSLKTSSGTVKVNKAVIYSTAPGDTSTIVASHQFLWSGVGNPTFTTGTHVSDSLSVVTDADHDWYIVVFWDATTSGNIFVYDSSSNFENVVGVFGYFTGDWTATIPSATFNNFCVGIAKLVLS